MTVTIYSRKAHGKKGKWGFHSIYTDGMPGGKEREIEYAANFRKRENDNEYKIEVTDNE
jgi:hypothetical protein|tara:strand:+ start:489 stop:665 length:177 start_codon:yes stop_codon:yes gene_type:complete